MVWAWRLLMSLFSLSYVMSSKMLLLVITVLWSNYGLSQSSNTYIRNLYSRSEGAILFNQGQNLILIRTANARSLNITAPDGINILDTIVRNDSILIEVYPYKPGERYITISEKTTGRTIKKIDFQEQEVSNPFVRAGSIKTSNVAKNVLLLQTGLVVANTNENYKSDFVVREYTFKVDLPTKTTVSINVKGPYFTEEIKTVLRQLPHNTTIEFVDILANCPRCCFNRALPSIRILVQ